MFGRIALCALSALILVSVGGCNSRRDRVGTSRTSTSRTSGPATSTPKDGTLPSGGDASTTPPSFSGYPTCSDSEDCPYWYCECGDTGAPVNSAHCTNGVCEDAADSCPTSCAAFGSCWTGYAEGGFDEGRNSGVNDC